MSSSLRKATLADTPALAPMLARAFADDPWVTWLVRKDARRDAARERFFRLSCDKLTLAWGESWMTEDAGGCALWVPPGKWRLSFLEQLPNLPAFARVTGVWRMLGVYFRSAKVGNAHPAAPHWYLFHLAVDPPQQGKGVGSRLLRPALDRCDREKIGAYLETAKEQNLGFYRKQGFELVGEHQITGGPKIWTMWRDAQ